jgi:hypothetical protein
MKPKTTPPESFVVGVPHLDSPRVTICNVVVQSLFNTKWLAVTLSEHKYITHLIRRIDLCHTLASVNNTVWDIS